ncbi:MAG: hypothetical protein K0V04_43770 [Deltaproteobacteria bacterium]|nr:hypothetical protein [Deltaproteobacteria bacterium]
MKDPANNPRSTALLCSALALAGLSGCIELDATQSEEQLSLSHETEEIVDNLEAAGMPEAEVEVRDDGTVILGGDAVVSLQASREMAGARAVPSLDGHEFRQHATHNLLSDSIEVICLVESSAYTGVLSDGLDSAIERYNELNLSFTFERGDAGSCDAIINLHTRGGYTAIAGFPANGQPFEHLSMATGIANLGEDVTRHVLMHELGHTIGLRHTDYYDRGISCPQGGDESDLSHGANHIEGTPTTAIMGGSVLNACYSSASDGLWTLSDLQALATLYGTGAPAGPNTCIDACGSNAGSCWCDDQCEFYGDCCEDKVVVCEEGQGGDPEIPEGDGHFAEGSFCDLYNGESITLHGTHGRFVSSGGLASGGSLTQVITAGTDEQFEVTCRSGTKVTLQTSNGQFLDALGDTGPSSIGQHADLGSNRAWVPEQQSDGRWAFRSFGGLHIRARPSGANYVVDLYGGAVGTWKHFTVAIS